MVVFCTRFWGHLWLSHLVNKGPDFDAYPYDEFRDIRSRPKWKAIAGNAFHLTNLGKSLLEGMKS